MRRLTALLLLSLLLSSLAFAQSTSAADADKRANDILNKMTLEEKIDYIGGYESFYVRAMPRLGLPALKMADGPIGIRNYGPSTTVAGGIGLAATWDPDLAHRTGKVLGEDGRARGVHFLLGPGVNIYRAPMNGRNFEYFGEDPFLSSRIAVGYIEGLQSQGVCATIKHYMGNNSEYDRHNVDSIIDERTMREIYLPVFEAAVKEAHVCSIMDSYNLTNGQHLSQDDYLNNQVAKKDWAFEGIIMSDWDATYDGVAAANGGLDLEMPSAKFMNRANLLPAIKSGRVTEATIDDHVRRILREAILMGWLDRDQTDLSIPLLNPEGREVSLEAARSGMVLLKNDGHLLPLDKTTKTLAVIGPDAYPAEPVGGGSAGVQPFRAVDFLEGISNYPAAGMKVLYKKGIPSLSEMARDTRFSSDANGTQPGLQTDFFSSLDLSGSVGRSSNEKSVNFGGDHPLPADFRSARWSGYFLVKDAGAYHVVVQDMGEQGGVHLFLDGKLIVDTWKLHKVLVNDVVLNLEAGPHQIRFEVFRKSNWGNTALRLAIVNSSSLVDQEALKIASKADAVVVAVGFDPTTESEGSDRTFGLPVGQDELIHAVLVANKKVIVVVTSGGGVDMSGWVDQTPAIIEAWYPGQEGGTALAQLLFGDFSPSGKLPISIERRLEDNPAYRTYYYSDPQTKKVEYSEGVFVGYRGYDKSGVKPLFPFGFGLSYSTFKFSNLKAAKKGEGAEVSFDVSNTGKRAAAEVAEVYVGSSNSAVPMPAKELKGFAKLNLKPGETRHLTIPLNQRAFAYYDTAGKQWKVDAGEYSILVGDSSDNLPMKATVSMGK